MTKHKKGEYVFKFDHFVVKIAPTLNDKEFQRERGKPVGYLQAWQANSTRDYREQIQRAARVTLGLELGAS